MYYTKVYNVVVLFDDTNNPYTNITMVLYCIVMYTYNIVIGQISSIMSTSILRLVDSLH